MADFVVEGFTSMAVADAVVRATNAPYGGVVMFPPGVHSWDIAELGPLVLPQRVNSPVHLVGAGDMTSHIKFTGDTGPDTFGLRASAHSGGNYSVVKGLRLLGPNAGGPTVNGSPPAQVSAIEMSAGMRMERCSATGWYAAARIVGDHIAVTDCRLGGGNYTGLHFADMATQGDLAVYNTDLMGATFASVLMSAGSMLTGATWTQGHLGGAPYCVYAEPGASMIGSVVFIATSWESIGHGAIVSADRKLQLAHVSWRHCGGFNADPSLRIGARSDFVVFDVGVSNDLRMEGCTPMSLASPAGPPFRFAGLADSVFDPIPASLMVAARTAGVRLFDANVGGLVRFSGDESEGVLCTSVSGGSQHQRGDLVARRPNKYIERTGNHPNAGPAFGVALEGAEGPSRSVLVARSGKAAVRCSNAAPDFARLVADTAPGSARSEPVTSPRSAQQVGTVRTATTAPGLVDADLAIGSA